VDGDTVSATVAVDAIKMIEREAQTSNLTERVREFIVSMIPEEE
jgi:exosome complex component RRP4